MMKQSVGAARLVAAVQTFLPAKGLGTLDNVN